MAHQESGWRLRMARVAEADAKPRPKRRRTPDERDALQAQIERNEAAAWEIRPTVEKTYMELAHELGRGPYACEILDALRERHGVERSLGAIRTDLNRLNLPPHGRGRPRKRDAPGPAEPRARQIGLFEPGSEGSSEDRG